ncbi:oligosaccharide flippase family protein [Citrobacter gillenii]|uniref:oligosaccharide flippase family protein n=1 Tax=Citrobacter gillenii TaxID=67828 RepID=UPI0039872D74
MFKSILSHRVFKNSTALILMQLFSYVSPLLVLPYLARVMSVHDFGTLMMIYSLLAISLVITDFGFNLSGTYFVSKNQRYKNTVNEYLTSVFCIKFVLAFFSIAIFYSISSFFFDGLSNISLFLILFIIFIQSFQPVWFFQGIEKMKHITIYTIISKIIYLSFVFIFANDGSISKILICYFFSQVMATSFSLYFIIKLGYSFERTTLKNIIRAFKESTPFFFSRVAVVIYTSANTLILGKYSSVVQAASYSSCEKIYYAGQSLLNPISQAFFPYLSKDKGKGKNKQNYLSFVIISGVLLSILCYISSFFVYDLLNIFYGGKFNDSASVLNIFLFTTVVAYFSVNFGYPMFALIDKINYVNYTVIIGAIFHIVGLSILTLFGKLTAYNLASLVLFVELSVLISRTAFYYMLQQKEKVIL